MKWALIGLVFAQSVGVTLLAQALRNQTRNRADHLRCIGHVSALTSDRAIAAALNEAADRWDSVEEKPVLRMLAEDYEPGGPSMPAIWLRHEAKRIIEEKARG